MDFPNIGERRTFRRGVRHICRADWTIRQLVKKHGVIEFTAGGDPFESLVEAVISQQLNGHAARVIFGRLKALVNSEVLTAQSLEGISTSSLRRAGVSPQKMRYLRGLSSCVSTGQLDLHDFDGKSDDEVIRILDEVKGIGRWTAHMFLLFTLGRPDVLPVDDLGIQTSIRKVYSLRKLPDAEKIRKIAAHWHPYCSVASLYLWHAKSKE